MGYPGEQQQQSSGLTSALPVIGSAIDFGSGLLGGLFNANQARLNRNFQREMYTRQLLDQRENWRMMNEYNLPSAQLQRLRDAGLNSLLMYSNGASGMTVSSPAEGAKAPSGAQANMTAHTNFGQAMAQAALINAQIKNIEADTKQKESVARGNNINSEINEATKDVQIAMRFGQHDLLNQSIRNMSAALINEGMITAEQCATLAQARIYQIKQFHLSEEQIGNEYEIGLGQIANGRIQANASMRQAAAAMQNAISQAKLTNAQVGVLIKTAAKLQLDNEYLEKTMNYRVYQQRNLGTKSYWDAVGSSWTPLLNEAGISKTQSEIFLNTLRGRALEVQTNQTEQDMLLQPAGLLLDYGRK